MIYYFYILPTHVGVNRFIAAQAFVDAMILPTHVGVNRRKENMADSFRHSPHARGGEPAAMGNADKITAILPTHVGVNRLYAPAASWH